MLSELNFVVVMEHPVYIISHVNFEFMLANSTLSCTRANFDTLSKVVTQVAKTIPYNGSSHPRTVFEP